MAARVFYTLQAERALFAILTFIARDNETAGLRFIADLEKRLHDTLSLFPEAGAKVPSGRRFLTIRRYSIVYRFDPVEDAVFVLDIAGTGQNWR